MQSLVNTALILVTTSFPCECEFQFVGIRVKDVVVTGLQMHVKMADSSDRGGALSSAKALPLSQ